MKDKIKIIFIPTLLALAGLIVIYTFLNWILFIKLEVFGLKELITNFAIPAGLTGLLVLFFIRPKLKILRLEAKRGNWRDFYSFILWIALTVPLMIAQNYMVTATGELAELNSIDEISHTKKAKFYTVKQCFIDKKAIGVHPSFEVTGKHNENFSMHIYVALPIFATAADTAKRACPAWLGITYHETISNRLEPSEKERKYEAFALKSQRDLDTRDVSKFVYLDRIGNSDEKEGLTEAIKENAMIKGSETILVPVNEPFEARNGNKLPWIFGSSLIGLSVWLLMILIPKTDATQLQRIQAGKPDRQARRETKDLIAMLKPGEGYYITPLLIYANVGIYLLMVVLGLGFISFKGQDLINWGANYGPLTKSGEWWRLLTSTFLHGGLMHVLANMYGLFFVGIFLEPLLGRKRFLTAYLLTGLFASIASIWWYEATISVGASGAIFGLYGLFLALMLTRIFPPAFTRGFLLSTLLFVGYNLLMGLAGGIDNAAHIGGLASGFVAGLALYPTLKKETAEEVAE